ncbi:MAG: hydroxymethylbilane synthase [Gammaproteobacteria bacterium]|nr:hydroxymethylbilane synthase [Gammaproteobacteria bacterium]
MGRRLPLPRRGRAVKPLRIGTRGSALALWQAGHVAALLRAQPDAPPVELVQINTSGDVQTEVPLWQSDGRAFFTREIDRALLEGTVDIAVHSLKDLPTRLDAGLALGATLRRAEVRDALLSRDGMPLAQLPRGARVGTSSLRRRAFLARARPDLAHAELRGNVPTRLERLRQGEYDAIVLAGAGLERLELSAAVSEYLPVEHFPPAVGQGAIGVCARESDAATLRRLLPLEDPATRLAVSAERALLRRLEGGCQVPLGALGVVHGQTLRLSATVCALDGRVSLSAHGTTAATQAEAIALGEQLAQELLSRGAAALISRERARVEAP